VHFFFDPANHNTIAWNFSAYTIFYEISFVLTYVVKHILRKKIFYERNDLVSFILRDTHEFYNTNIRCNKKCMFYKDHGIDFSINNNYYTKIKLE